MANDVKRNDLTGNQLPPYPSGSWRVTATWHQEMAGTHPQLGAEVRAAWRNVLGCLAALAVLALALPGPADLMAAVVDAPSGGSSGATARTGGASTTPAFLDTAQHAVLLAAGVIVWGLLLWGLVVVAVAGIGRLPGVSGRAARKVLRHIAPATAGRLVIAAVGVTAIAGVSGCAAADGSAATVSAADAAAFAPASSIDPAAPTFDIDWPAALAGGSTAPSAGDPQAPATPAAPAPAAPPTVPTPATTGSSTAAATPPTTDPTAGSTPTETSEPSTATSTEAARSPDSTPSTVATPSPVPTPNPDSTSGADGSVTVQPGDTLWDIAAHHLPANATDVDIDTAWRAWYSANTELIGADPDLILPGQHLLPGDSETRPSP